jgi:hypothetical protein
MTEPHMPNATSAHALHDPELIAALAAREPDLKTADRATAQVLVDACADCRGLLADLRALQIALPATTTPARPRGFTLTTADAHQLRGSGWRRVVRFFGSSRDAFSRPLAIGFTTIGIVALLITALPSIPLGAGGATSLSTVGNAVPQQAPETAEMVASPAASAAAAAAPSAAPAAAPSAAPTSASEFAPASAPSVVADRQRTSGAPEPYSGDTGGGVFSGSNEASGRTGDIQAGDTAGTESLLAVRDDGISIGFVIAGISLIIGFGLFALRWMSRRFGDG